MPEMRTFETGATRSPDATRDDPEGFLSPLVIDRFNEYMTKHRVQADGGLRDSDNWQKGMPLKSYMKGGWRHFFHWWTRHRGWPVRDELAGTDIEEDLCALLFNVQGYLHETIKERMVQTALQAAQVVDKPVQCSAIREINYLKQEECQCTLEAGHEGAHICDKHGADFYS